MSSSVQRYFAAYRPWSWGRGRFGDEAHPQDLAQKNGVGGAAARRPALAALDSS